MTEELKNLYTLLEKIRVAILGSDPQSRKEYTFLKERVIQKIKSIESELSLTKENGILSR